MNHPFSSFGEMLAAAAGQQDQDEMTFPQREAQRETLLELLKGAGPRKFKKGTFVRYVPPGGPLTKKATDEAELMFWRYLDFTREDDKVRVRHSVNFLHALDRLDCLVAWYSGDAIRFNVSSSEMLEPVGETP